MSKYSACEHVLEGVGRLCFPPVGSKRVDYRCENLKQSNVQIKQHEMGWWILVYNVCK